MDCKTPVMAYDRSQKFIISDKKDFCGWYTTIYSAMRDTGISQAALDNAAMNGNRTITRRAKTNQHERMVFDIT